MLVMQLGVVSIAVKKRSVATLAIINGAKGRVNQNVPVACIANVREEMMVPTHLTRSGGNLSLIRLRVMLKDVIILPQLFDANLVLWCTIALRHVNAGINMLTPKIV